MSIDIKNSRAYLTDDGWMLDVPNKDDIREVVIVKAKQNFYGRPWIITVLERKLYAKNERIAILHEKFGDEPSGDLEW